MPDDAARLYEAIGGAPTCSALSEAFYARVQSDPVLRPLFPGKTLRCAIEQFTAFLAQFLGGPAEDAQARWWLSLRESHGRFKIGLRERSAWMKNMLAAVDDVPIKEPVRSALLSFFERSSAYVVNTAEAPAAGEGEPSNGEIDREISCRWDAQRTLDQVIHAIRRRDGARAIALADGPTLAAHFAANRSVFAAVLGCMIGSGDPALLAYVHQALAADPALVQVRYSGRALLHAAAAAGELAIVELLLSLGAKPDTLDDGEHAALYCVANECKAADGAMVVRALVRAGASVDANGGAKHCTALHMAARRGNVAIAEALLDCGADIEARDSAKDTPLRRAVNCDKTAVAALLLSRGAYAHSTGSKGITPVLAVRSAAMKRVLGS